MVIKYLLLILMSSCLANIGVASAESRSASGDNNYTLYVDEMNKSVATKTINVSYSLSATEVFARQFLTIQYQLDSNDSFITLTIDFKNSPGKGVIPLNVKKKIINAKNGFKYRYVLNVKYYTMQAGKQTLDVPTLIYSVGGKVAQRIGFKSQSIENKPLPPYMPPYIPVGEIVLKSSLPQSDSWLGWYETDKIYYWDIYLRAKNITPDMLPEIRQQLRSNRNIEFFPAETKLETVKGYNEVTQKIHYSIPFVFKSNGRIVMPELRLQSFNTMTQRLDNQRYAFKPIYVLNYYFQWMINVLIAALFLLFIWYVLPRVSSMLHGLSCLADARRQIKQASTATQLRAGMQSLAISFSWPENQSLKIWQSRWIRELGGDKKVNELVKSISIGLYSTEQVQKNIINEAKSIFRKPIVKQYWICLLSSSCRA